MLSLNAVSAWVEVDGKELEQHGIEVDHAKSQVTCWIATQADQAFSVIFRDDAGYREHSLASSLYLDGSSVGGKILRPSIRIGNLPHNVNTRTVIQNTQVLSATSSRPFVFSKLELTDEDEYLDQVSTHLGEIRLHIERVQALESYVSDRVSSAPGHAKVHERSKKAVTHCVSYGKEVQTQVMLSCRTRRLDGDVPLVTFIFRYRDSGLLQANGIIPKPPPVEKKAVASEEVLDLTVDNRAKPEPVDDIIEIDDGITEHRRRAGALTKRSTSSCRDEVKPAKRIKREKKFVPTSEVIDLT